MAYPSIAGRVSNAITGWADYVDTQYTDIAPFSVLADTDTVLPNNAGAVLDAYKPELIDTFYNGTTITGSTGDARLITLSLNALPTSANTTQIEFWFDIGGAVGELYRRISGFPKGNGVIRPITLSTGVYTLDTWQANGATVYVRANGTVDLYDIRYVITQLHTAA